MRTEKARHDAYGCRLHGAVDRSAPRAAFFCRVGFRFGIGFALTLLLLAGFRSAVEVTPLAASPATDYFALHLDRDGNGVEDVLDDWRRGVASWRDLQETASSGPGARKALDQTAFAGGVAPLSAFAAQDRVRLLCLGATAGQLDRERQAGNALGICATIQDLDRFGGVTVLAVDEQGLADFLAAGPGCAVMLDRDGTPALVDSRRMVGVGRVTSGDFELGNDWSGSVAILDSGMDSAHGDLGDAPDDDTDGPAPRVGDAGDWFDAAGGWPLFQGYKAVGWHDVTDDFPASQGPWDYNYHGTALASVVAGSGAEQPDFRGLAPGGRLTIVKYYDFDLTWHAWAGDFLAACAWTLDNRETYRIRTVLTAANWDVDAGISTAMSAFVDVGILPVAAMGNDGAGSSGPGFPASLTDVLTAGAVNGSGAVSAFSGRGTGSDAKPDLVAPGGGSLPGLGRIVAADNEPNDSYSGRFGTSLAAAHVAGAAYLLDEALLENGLAPARDRAGVAARHSVLKLATAFVDLAETPDGTGVFALGDYAGHDASRGYGLLRIDAAVRAMLELLRPGQTQTDTLSEDWQKPVLARRLDTGPGISYVVEVDPAIGLDVALEVAGVGGDVQVVRSDSGGAGAVESVTFSAGETGWSFLVVKRLGGAGGVSLSLREEGAFATPGAGQAMPGVITGAPNIGYLAPWPGPSLLVSSRVQVDPVANSLNVLDPAGNFRPGWPVFVFPASSSQGGLSQPMAVNLDGVPGDEIVVASDFGSVYFFTGSGEVSTVDLELNRPLTRPVGFRNAIGGWRVLVVDKLGWARSWSWNAAVGAPPELESEVFLGRERPLAPAAGRLTSDGGESVVVAFADGWLGVLDENLALRPGWPVILGGVLEAAPVLVDLNDDGLHEVVVPVRDVGSGGLTMRVLDGAGQSLSVDGSPVPVPGGGSWLAVSNPAVAGSYGQNDLRVVVNGLTDNGRSGVQAEWSLSLGRLSLNGVTQTVPLPGFTLAASTAEGVLQLDALDLPAPLAWKRRAGMGAEEGVVFHIQWRESLYGFTAVPGATTGWLLDPDGADPLPQKVPLRVGGSLEPSVTELGAMLVPLSGGVLLRVDTLDRQLSLVPEPVASAEAPRWRAARGDQRNSGAYPLNTAVAGAATPRLTTAGLRAFPNPGSGRLRLRGQGIRLAAETRVEIFDLRGRRVSRLRGADAEGIVFWDGRDDGGRPLPAGTYLAVARSEGRRLTTRLVLTR